MSDVIQIITTTPTVELAERIARQLVERRQAACVQIDGPITSVYRWQGAIETSEEWRLSIKTHQRLFAEVEQTIRALHEYQVPEVLALPVAAGSTAYLEWMAQEL